MVREVFAEKHLARLKGRLGVGHVRYPTVGTGEDTDVVLPWSGLGLSISTRYWQDSYPGDRRPWIAPDLPVPVRAADYFAGFVARTTHALALAQKWSRSKNESVRRTGYSTLNALLKHGPPDGVIVETKLLANYLDTIEAEIHDAPNRAREAMNTTLICIGTYHDPLHKQAVAAAKRIGKVEVFHGEGTQCKDFIAENEIAKARAHLARRYKKADAKK